MGLASRLNLLTASVEELRRITKQALATMRQTRRERAELRAILAPLLDNPCRWNPVYRHYQCLFCQQATDDAATHASTCPVLRRDALLGRPPQ